MIYQFDNIFFYRDRDLTSEEKALIKDLATKDNVVKLLQLNWELYMNSNTTAGINVDNMTNTAEFKNNSGTIHKQLHYSLKVDIKTMFHDVQLGN